MTATVPVTIDTWREDALEAVRKKLAPQIANAAELEDALDFFRKVFDSVDAPAAWSEEDQADLHAFLIRIGEEGENPLNQNGESLYDKDVVAWSERQARLMRSVALGVISPKALDWDNLIEEIESVGREQVHAVESTLVQALIHDLKCAAWPDVLYVSHWQAEARVMRRNVRRRFTNSMRQKIEAASLYADALDGLPKDIDGRAPLPVPTTCAATLDQMMAGPVVPAPL